MVDHGLLLGTGFTTSSVHFMTLRPAKIMADFLQSCSSPKKQQQPNIVRLKPHGATMTWIRFFAAHKMWQQSLSQTKVFGSLGNGKVTWGGVCGIKDFSTGNC